MVRSVVLVCGPPCAGKSTYVAGLAKPGDLILDADKFAVEAGSPHDHDHTNAHRAIAEQRMQQQLGRLLDAERVRAWVIRSLPNGDERAGVARRIGATQTVMLMPSAAELHRRAGTRSRWTHTAIDAWLAAYTPDPHPPREPRSRRW